MTFLVKSTGEIMAVYSDGLLDLLEPDNIEVTRASNVEFNNTTKQWEARLAKDFKNHKTGYLIAAGESRAVVIEKEIDFIASNLVECDIMEKTD
jgi:hypothetical protein